VGKITVIYINFLRDVACQKLLKSADVSWSYSKNNTGTVFVTHGEHTSTLMPLKFDKRMTKCDQ